MDRILLQKGLTMRKFLRCGILVEVESRLKSGHMVVKVLQLPSRGVTRAMRKYWPVGQERVLTPDGKGHQWGPDYDVIDAI